MCVRLNPITCLPLPDDASPAGVACAVPPDRGCAPGAAPLPAAQGPGVPGSRSQPGVHVQAQSAGTQPQQQLLQHAAVDQPDSSQPQDVGTGRHRPRLGRGSSCSSSRHVPWCCCVSRPWRSTRALTGGAACQWRRWCWGVILQRGQCLSQRAGPVGQQAVGKQPGLSGRQQASSTKPAGQLTHKGSVCWRCHRGPSQGRAAGLQQCWRRGAAAWSAAAAGPQVGLQSEGSCRGAGVGRCRCAPTAAAHTAKVGRAVWCCWAQAAGAPAPGAHCPDSSSWATSAQAEAVPSGRPQQCGCSSSPGQWQQSQEQPYAEQGGLASAGANCRGRRCCRWAGARPCWRTCTQQQQRRRQQCGVSSTLSKG